MLGWLQIVTATTFGAGLIALLLCMAWNNSKEFLVATIITSAGFVVGCILATRIWKKHGTINWLSNISKTA